MTFTTSAWDRPIQGVSQQPPKVRLPGQSTIQENAVSSVVNGLIKRPGTIRLGTLENSFPENTHYYYYNRGSGERYFVIISPLNYPRVFDLDGVELTVEYKGIHAPYINSATPADDFKLTTISDFTFIVNKTFTPQKSPNLTGSLGNTAIINVQFADYGRDYRIVINDQEVARYSAPDGGDASQITQVDTSFIAYALVEGDNRDDPGNTGPATSGFHIISGLRPQIGADYNIDLRGNTIIVSRKDGGDFSIRTEDGADGRDLFVVKNAVKDVTDLPLFAPTGYKVRVVGQGNSSDDDYWLEARESSGDTVRWVESTGASQSVGFNHDTMPHVLIRDRFENGRAVFSLQRGDWADRDVGDNDSNPFPSFIEDGVPITSVGTFQNRLYFTAGESVVYSRSNYFFQFFRQTVRSPLDDDPIDVYADTNQVNFIENSSVLDGDVVFFSANGQFLQDGNEAITKSNATLQYASTFENIADCVPAAAGDVIFFAFEYGRFTGIREFYTDSFTDTKRARPVTDHVDEYIEGRAKLLATSTNRNQLFVLADNENEVYVYNWLWQGQERVQSSWSKWVFSGAVRFIAYDNDAIYFLIERNGKLELEYIEPGDPDDPGLTFPARLDRRMSRPATRINGVWSVDVPMVVNDAVEELVIVRGDGCLDEGVTVSYNRQDDTTLITDEDIAAPEVNEAEVIVGIRYKMVYQPTMPFVKDRNGRVIDTDRLIINDVNINYDKTGNTSVLVENEWGNSREYEFNGRVLGAVNNLVGFAPLRPGQFSFPVRQESERVTFTLETVSHLPFQLRDMEWRGRFTQRGRRL